MNTKRFEVGTEQYCHYCGKMIVREIDSVDEYGVEYEYKCDCELAEQEMRLREEKSVIEHKLYLLEGEGITSRERESIIINKEIEKLEKQIIYMRNINQK